MWWIILVWICVCCPWLIPVIWAVVILFFIYAWSPVVFWVLIAAAAGVLVWELVICRRQEAQMKREWAERDRKRRLRMKALRERKEQKRRERMARQAQEPSLSEKGDAL